MKYPRFLSLIVAAALCTTTVQANDNWPQFRGPTGQGISTSKDLPTKWSDTENVKWKTAIHGKGWSTPVVFGDQVWVTTATLDGKKSSVLCLDRETGKVLHDRVVFENETVEPLGNPLNAYASPSPAIEDGRVYVHFGSYGTACIDTKTFETLWERRDLPCRHYRGPGSSVIIFENMLILTMDGVDVQYLVALDKMNGKTIWKTDRTTDFKDIDEKTKKPKAEGDYRKAYTTPVIVNTGGKLQLISPGARAAFAYEPHTGKEIWTVAFPGFSNATSAVVKDNVTYISTGHGKTEMIAVKTDGKGDVTDSHVLWRIGRNMPLQPSSVIVGDLMFQANDGGIATCIDLKTGDLLWTQRLGDGKEQYSASALYADGKVFFFGREGLCTIIEPAAEFKLIATNKLPSGMMASPAVAGKSLFLRTKTHLYRIEK